MNETTKKGKLMCTKYAFLFLAYAALCVYVCVCPVHSYHCYLLTVFRVIMIDTLG